MVQEKNMVRLGLTIILFIALLGLVITPTPALAGGKGKHWHPKACSKTATAAYIACYNEKKDDYWIAQGNCYNLFDKEAQVECFADAKEEYKEAKEECRDQLEARKDLCDELGEEPYDPEIEPAHFVDPEEIGGEFDPNPYFPLMPGSKWLYKTAVRGEGITETNTDEVLLETKEIMGVECVVVHDVVYEGDSTSEDDILEDTYDYYAQDVVGNVWYFGEFSLSFEEELPSMEGSWIFGMDDAKPGIIMFANPEEGVVYRQEFALGDAEDAGEIISLGDGSVTVPYGTFNRAVLKTRDFTPIEPDVEEFKYYAPRVGVILEEADGERTELYRFAPGS
jgi:hypothetical protein